MARYFLFLAYNGSGFHGWQDQPDAVTVQRTVEHALGCLLPSAVRLTGAGRTDTGVHASYYVAHFDSEQAGLEDNQDFLRHLNGILPRTVAVFGVRRMSDTAHARFDAVSRTYRYAIMRVRCPFALSGWHHEYRPLDVPRMEEACRVLGDYTDFTSFSKVHTDVRTFNCRIMDAHFVSGDWAQMVPMLHRYGPEAGEAPADTPASVPLSGYPALIFEITADRFLRNMVRAIMGTLLQVGTGRCTPDDVRCIIEAKDRCAAGMSVPADGLYLTDIRYPYPVL
jgi:tRNA pseudouridine38-40 synthase